MLTAAAPTSALVRSPRRGLDLTELRFCGVDPESTGRPSYHPSVLLKLYISTGRTWSTSVARPITR
jgi:hypothetical protein